MCTHSVSMLAVVIIEEQNIVNAAMQALELATT